jgi:hypothetical protein
MKKQLCNHGIKKSGECKKKPGPKSSSRKTSRKSRKPSRKVSRKTSRKSRKPSRKVSRKTSRKVSRKSRKPSRKVSRKTSREISASRKRKYMTIARCKEELKEKIKNNVREYNEGERWSSRAQSIAVAYAQIQKKYPSCKKHLKKSLRKTLS